MTDGATQQTSRSLQLPLADRTKRSTNLTYNPHGLDGLAVALEYASEYVTGRSIIGLRPGNFTFHRHIVRDLQA